MGYTKFGEFMRILRVKNHEVMGDTAKALGVSTPFLSAVETGKKHIPKDWCSKIVKIYNLNTQEKKALKEAIERSKDSVKISLLNAEDYKKTIALQFQRSFNEIDEETAEKIVKLLTQKRDD